MAKYGSVERGMYLCNDSRSWEQLASVTRDVRAVLDLDSRMPAAFSRAESDRIEALLAKAFADVAWPPYAA